MQPEPEQRKSPPPEIMEKDLYRIMVFSTCLGFATLAAFLYSIQDMDNNVSLVFSRGTVVAFALGWASGWAFWRGIRLLIARNAEKQAGTSHNESPRRAAKSS